MDYIGVIENDLGLEKEEQIIIYGAGKVGRHTLEVLEKSGLKGNVVCFCDNSRDMWGKSINGVTVYHIAEACAMYPQGIYLISSMYVRQMAESLLQYGINKIHIIRESSVEEGI